MSSAAAYLPFDAEVQRVCDLTPSVRRVTLTGPRLDEVAPLCLDRRVKLVLPRSDADSFDDLPRSGDWYAAWQGLDAATRPAFRTYTTRDVRPAAREVDIDVVRHGTAGPAGRWIEAVEVGSPVLLVAPVSAFPGIDGIGLAWKPGSARTVLVAGDETAAPAVTNIIESLPADARGLALIETPTSADTWPVLAPRGVTVTFLPRDGAPHGHVLEQVVRARCWDAGSHPTAAPAGPDDPADDRPDAPPIWEEPSSTVTADHFAWLAGESGAITRLRRHLVSDRGWPRDRVAFMGYWKLGRAEA